MTEIQEKYISTKDVKSALSISGCEVMHLRESGKLLFIKKGNAFWYLRTDVEKLKVDR